MSITPSLVGGLGCLLTFLCCMAALAMADRKADRWPPLSGWQKTGLLMLLGVFGPRGLHLLFFGGMVDEGGAWASVAVSGAACMILYDFAVERQLCGDARMLVREFTKPAALYASDARKAHAILGPALRAMRGRRPARPKAT